MSWKNRGPMFCRTCEAHQVKTEIYFDNEHKTEGGKSIPMEKNTRQPHQCQFSPYAMKQQQNFSLQQQKEFVKGFGYGQRQQDNIEGRPDTYKTTSPEQHLPPVQQQIREYRPEPQNYNEYFKALETKLDNIGIAVGQLMGMLENHLDNNPKEKEVLMLRQTVTQLQESLANHEKTFVPANKVQQDIEPEAMAAEAENEHVRRVMNRGKEDEELEL